MGGMMLADLPNNVQAGSLDPAVQLPDTARYALLDFIADELPRWRDHPKRMPQTRETALTSQLCNHLNSATRTSAGWSWIQFRTEIPDEVQRGRAIDLAPHPCGVDIIIEGRSYSPFDMLFPIECKRLPTPKEKNRDEREYVVTSPGTTGGIQRFKFGYHGATHCVGAMIAYVQDKSCSHWLAQVNGWIRDLSTRLGPPWSLSDMLQILKDDSVTGLCTLDSRHRRRRSYDKINLRHFWIKMN